MGWQNTPMSWAELERKLSGTKPLVIDPLVADGGDSPAWTRKRDAYKAPALMRSEPKVRYAELHCHTNFSFLDGASHPEELAEEAVRLGLTAVAVTDHDGFYGVVRFSEAANALEIPTVFGAELSLGLPQPQNGEPDPVGRHLLVLARGPKGYAKLARVIGLAHLDGKEKGKPNYDIEETARTLDGHGLILTGCRKGHVPSALLTDGVDAAARELD